MKEELQRQAGKLVDEAAKPLGLAPFKAARGRAAIADMESIVLANLAEEMRSYPKKDPRLCFWIW